MKNRKCKYCKCTHHNTEISKELVFKDVCMNCERVKELLDIVVMAINNHTSVMGKRRKLTILDFKIEKTNE